MEPLFQFLGHFWWLVFPLMGVAGGVARAWERTAHRRHKRRLEILRAKSELTAAKRGGVPTGAVATAPVDDRGTDRGQLERLFAAQDAVTRRWLDYELDVAKLIAYPAMSDGRQPLTAAFLRAKKLADGLRPSSATVKITPAQLSEYRNAVTDYEVAFDVAERDARRIRDSSFTDAERRRLDTAKKLLTVAVDQAATPAERHLAYQRVREELDGLLSLSDEAIDDLERKVALELPAGPSSTSPATASRDEPPRTIDSHTQATAGDPTPSASPAPAPREPKTAPWPVPAHGSTAPGRVVRAKPHG